MVVFFSENTFRLALSIVCKMRRISRTSAINCVGSQGTVTKSRIFLDQYGEQYCMMIAAIGRTFMSFPIKGLQPIIINIRSDAEMARRTRSSAARLRTGHFLLLKGCWKGTRGYLGRLRQERSGIAMGGRRSLCELHEVSMENMREYKRVVRTAVSGKF
jgi:hypothetical protein